VGPSRTRTPPLSVVFPTLYLKPMLAHWFLTFPKNMPAGREIPCLTHRLCHRARGGGISGICSHSLATHAKNRKEKFHKGPACLIKSAAKEKKTTPNLLPKSYFFFSFWGYLSLIIFPSLNRVSLFILPLSSKSICFPLNSPYLYSSIAHT
jgi:hypothetical protein